jgi:hypothetical protein
MFKDECGLFIFLLGNELKGPDFLAHPSLTGLQLIPCYTQKEKYWSYAQLSLVVQTVPASFWEHDIVDGFDGLKSACLC